MDPAVTREMDPAELRRRVEEIRWFHTIDLGHGIVTQGHHNFARKLTTLQLPDRLDGKTVLDIGANDGGFSFEAERRGATRVLAVDPMWDNPVPPFTKHGFELARAALGSSVEDAHLNVHQLDPAEIGTFDVVMMLGVLYHLRNPMGGLERVAAVTGGQLILETECDLLDLRRPAAAFYPGSELNSDASNWWGLNRAALLGMLEAVGFRDAHVVYQPTRAQRFARAVRDRVTQGFSLHRGWPRGRLVVHAWR